MSMIAYLKGKVLAKGVNYVILQQAGIGYKIFVMPTAQESRVGDELSLYIYHKVAEDQQALFGLPDFASLQFFELLITVSGVGPKVALAILSAAPVEAVKQAIVNQDSGAFTRIAGVGTKTAEKIIVELKTKIDSFAPSGPSATSEVFDALLGLGYNQREVREVINKLDSALPPQEQIKQALKRLSKN